MTTAPTWSSRCARLGLLALIALFALACGGRAKPSATPGQLTVERLYPLRPGSVWTYDVDTGEGVPTLAITRVLSRNGQRVEVSSGSDPIVYEQRPEGLFRGDLDSYVLKGPIAKGSYWEGSGGSRVEITDVQKTVVSPAGSFEGCVEVLESAGQGQKHVRTVFCPDVGPVEIESTLQMALTGSLARVVARLRGYDFSGALTAP